MEPGTISFTQFSYCTVCQISHKKGRKHIYTRCHNNMLHHLLQRFKNRINEAKGCIIDPEVHSGWWENDAKFWCYFCEGEFEKHSSDSEGTVTKCSAMILHLSSQNHLKKTKHFFWTNHVDKKEIPYYIFTKDELNLFATVVEEKKKEFLVSQQELQRKIVADLAAIQENRNKLVAEVRYELSKESLFQQLTSSSSDASTSNGLTNNAANEFSTKPKNIFTGAVPPWLRDDDEESSDLKSTQCDSIGPNIADFEAYKKAQAKKKLNPNRVGANFHNEVASTSASWLPSFGRVWNSGRRKQSKRQYENEKFKNKRPKM